jgi:EmrB/QacA subfamily drug resistance transporter
MSATATAVPRRDALPPQDAPPGGLPARGFHALTRQQLIGTIIALMLTLLLAALDQTIVGTAMPRIIAQLNGFDRYAWVTTAYLLTSTIAVPIFGKLSDIYGRKWFFLGGAILFVGASALCGAAQSMNQLIAFRGLQGLAGGIITGLTFTVIADIFPPAERGKFQGLFGAIWGLSSVIGPTLGGWITDNFSWRWVFYVNLPVGLIAVAVLFFAFPYFKPEGVTRSIDYLGVATLTACLVPLLLALTWVTDYGWGATRVIALLAVAAVMLPLFLFVETRAKEPIIPLALFRNSIVTVSSIALFLTGMGMFGAILFIPLFMQEVVGVSATRSGSTLTPMMLMLVLGSIVSGQIVSRIGRYKIISSVGLAVMVFGIYLLSGMHSDTSQWVAIRNMMVVGIGLGMVMPIYTLIVQNAVPVRMLGAATAATQFFRSIGGTIGAAVFGSIMLSRYQNYFTGHIPAGTPQQLQDAFKNPLQLGQILPRLQQQFGQTAEGARTLQIMLGNVKEALVYGLHGTFLIGAALVAVAFVANFFLKEIPLRKRMAPAAAMAEGGHEPEMAPALDAVAAVDASAPADATAPLATPAERYASQQSGAATDATAYSSNGHSLPAQEMTFAAPEPVTAAVFGEATPMREPTYPSDPSMESPPQTPASSVPAGFSPPGVPVSGNPATPAPDEQPARAAIASAFLAELERFVHAEIAASQRALDARLDTLEQAIAALRVAPQPADDPAIGDGRLMALEQSLASFQQASTSAADAAPAISAERFAALEQHVMQLDWRVQEWTGAPNIASDVDERIAALEQTVTNLDKFARTLPPARWHHMQDTRGAEIERRLAALEQALQQAAWDHNGQYQDSGNGTGNAYNAPAYAPNTPQRDYR